MDYQYFVKSKITLL